MDSHHALHGFQFFGKLFHAGGYSQACPAKENNLNKIIHVVFLLYTYFNGTNLHALLVQISELAILLNLTVEFHTFAIVVRGIYGAFILEVALWHQLTTYGLHSVGTFHHWQHPKTRR